jgi:hypothetical protein
LQLQDTFNNVSMTYLSSLSDSERAVPIGLIHNLVIMGNALLFAALARYTHSIF